MPFPGLPKPKPLPKAVKSDSLEPLAFLPLPKVGAFSQIPPGCPFPACPELLRIIYDLQENRLAKEYLKKNISCEKPKLFKQF